MTQDFPQLQLMQQLGRTYRTLLSAFDDCTGQPLPRWRILLELYRLGEMSQKALAEQLPMDPAALTRQLKAIEKLGWVQRHNDAADNRLTNVALTATGRQLVKKTLPRRTAFVQQAFEDLDEADMMAMGRILGALEAQLRRQTKAAEKA